MKHFSIFSVPVLALAILSTGCSDHHDAPESNGAAIRFSVVAPPTPRSASKIETTTATIDNFLLNAFTGGNVFISNLEVNGSNQNGWQYSPEYYWPANSVNFYAVSPILSGMSKPSGGADAFMAAYTNPGDVDLLYSVAADQTPTSSTTPKAVSLNFRHALSRVVVNLKSSNSQIKVKVYDVEFVNIAKSGIFEFPKVTTSEGGNEYGKWTEQSDIISAPVYSEAEGSDYLTAKATQFSNKNYNFAMPQELAVVDVSKGMSTGSFIKVTCVIDDSTESHNRLWPNSQTPAENQDGDKGVILFPLRTAQTQAASSSWEQGMGYIYNLDINKVPGLDVIDFTVTVDVIDTYTGVEIDSNI